jgi:hypothetical protein
MSMASSAARPALEIARFDPCAPDATEQRKLDRLRELRAVIDVLRGAAEARDPLLEWVQNQERAPLRDSLTDRV